MRCDKCMIKFNDYWTASKRWPRYKIKEITDFSNFAPINLCDKCSALLKEWLEEQPEEEEGF